MWLPGRLSLAKFAQANYTVLPVMPFLSNGQKHLTPANAVNSLLTNLVSNDLVFSFMITSTTETAFINKLEQLSNSWSLPDFKKALRISKTLAKLDANKMIIPVVDKSLENAPLSSSQTRLILNAKRTGQIKPLSMSNIESGLTSFKSKQQQLVNQIKQQSTNTGETKIDVFYYFGLANDLKKDIPNQNHIFTLMTGFVGKDIIKLLDLIELPL